MSQSFANVRTAIYAMLLIGLLVFTAMPAAHAQTTAVAAARAPGASAAAGTRLSPALPLKRDEGSNDPAQMVLVSAGLVLAVALGGYIALRRSGRLSTGISAAWGGRTQPTLRTGARLPLTQHASVHVVRWGDEELLLGSTPQQVTLLARRALGGCDQNEPHKEDAA